MHDLTFLRTAGVVEILLYLLEHPRGRRKIDIRTDLKINPATATKAHKILLQGGFLKQTKDHNAIFHSLTDDATPFVETLRDAGNELKKIKELNKQNQDTMVFNLIDKRYVSRE